MTKGVLFVAAASLAVHLILGWQWIMLVAVIAGIWFSGRAWLMGGFGIALSWLGLIVFNYMSAPDQVQEFARVMSSMMGNLPPLTTYAVTLLIGFGMGAVGAHMGRAFKSVLSTNHSAHG